MNKVKPCFVYIRSRTSLTRLFFKIDLPAAQPERIAAQIEATFGIDPSEILHISAKTGKGVDKVLEAIIERIPPPVAEVEAPFKAFLFDSLCVNFLSRSTLDLNPVCRYDKYRGVISLISVQNGVLRKGQNIFISVVLLLTNGCI